MTACSAGNSRCSAVTDLLVPLQLVANNDTSGYVIPARYQRDVLPAVLVNRFVAL
jgi:hypothetical protein